MRCTTSKILTTNTSRTAPDPTKQETNSALALFILITLLIIAFFASYTMQQRKIKAVHETVISIFAGRLQPLYIDNMIASD